MKNVPFPFMPERVLPLSPWTDLTQEVSFFTHSRKHMSNFELHKRNNPCPVCQDIKGDCRTIKDTGMVLCQTHINEDPDISGWKYLGVAKNPTWGMFVAADKQRTFDRSTWLKKKQERENRQKKATLNTLHRDGRNAAIRQLHKTLGLKREDRADLNRRGLTDKQIDRGLFFSKVTDQDIPSYIPANLPGVDRYGNNKLSGKDEGYICPAFDHLGRAVGWQIRIKGATKNKYKWAYQPELPNGEKPITFIRSNTEDSTLYVAEGFLKPYIASNKHSLNFIGAPGGHFHNSPQQVREILKLGFTHLVICPDAGDSKNRQTSIRWQNQIKFFQRFNIKVEVLWWGQTTKEIHQDIDEIGSLTKAKTISTDVFESFSTARIDDGFIKFLRKHLPKSIRDRVTKNQTIVRFGIDPIPKLGFAENIKVIFPQGSRNAAMTACAAAAWETVMDTSTPGTGKSHDMGLLKNPQSKVWIANKEHRNPSTRTIEENFKDLPTRHNGLNYDRSRKTPMGEPYQRIAKDWKEADIKRLCKNAKLFHKISALNYDPKEGDEKVNPVCANCEHFIQKRKTEDGERIMPKCATSTGDGYGYMYARGKGLLAKNISCSINSLPSPTDRNYAGDILAIDEADTEIEGTRTLVMKIHHVEKSLMRVAKFEPAAFLQLQNIFTKILPYLDGSKQQPFYGFERAEIFDILGQVPDNIDDLIATCHMATPTVASLITPRNSLERKGFSRKEQWQAGAVNEEFRRQADEETKRKIANLEPNWLVDFLQIWAGQIPGAIRISRHLLKVTTRNDRHGEIVRANGFTLLSDATGSSKAIAAKLGIHRNSIIEIAQEQPDFGNLTIINIQLHGIGSNRITKLAQERLNRVVNQLQKLHGEMPVIGHKSMGYESWWFNDTRGVNHFEGVEKLIFVGTPRKNIGAVRDEYFTLHGTYEGFYEYYQQLVKAEQLQAIFRQRSHRYPDRKFICFYIGTNLDLDFLEDLGINVVHNHAFDYSPESCRKPQVALWKIGEIIKTSIRCGDLEITQEKIAKAVGISQGRVSQLLNFGRNNWLKLKHFLLEKLLIQPNSEINKIVEPEINLYIARSMAVITGELLEEFVALDWQDFQLYLAQWSIAYQAKFIGLLLNVFLTKEEKTELFKDFYPPPT